jgi:hypothetical protein
MMNRRYSRLCGCLATLLPAVTYAAVDLAALDKDMVGPRTEILVLGSVHLSEHEAFDPKALDPLLDRLAAFKPGYITIEAISGEQCDLAKRHSAIYGDDYCASTETAKAATGLDVPAAIVQVNKTLASWPASPTPAQRRQLSALFLAAGERASAYVQWLQLPVAERRVGDGLDGTLIELLRQIETRRNESYQIAAVLAARLGLPRVYAVDDHTGDNHQIADRKAFSAALQQAWSGYGPTFDAMTEREAAFIATNDLLSLYRSVNDPAALQVLAESNVRPTLAAVSPQHYPQIWVQGWEIRNLRMVANILEVVRDHPGSRVLSIVGASHKPWFDGWLGQASGVDVVDTQTVLGGEGATTTRPDAQHPTP